MGRPEKPVNIAGGLIAQFAGELRLLRAQAGNPTYREMARSAMFSSSVLSSAASGNRMPSLPVTLAFVVACGGDEQVWRERWLAVSSGTTRAPARGRAAGDQPTELPFPAQLPPRPRRFVGRVDEQSWLHTPDETPIVISGAMGVGKTDLALRFAHALVPELTDGQLYADLGASTDSPLDPFEVLDGFLRALGVSGDQLSSTLDHRAGLFRTLLTRRKLLVLLDNVQDEQQVRPLLVDSPSSTTVLVSRNRLLGLRDVRRLRLLPLPRTEAITLVEQGLPSTVVADVSDMDRLAELCCDLPLALDIALRRIATWPHSVLRQTLDSWQQAENTLARLRIGDLSMMDTIRSTYLTLSIPAQILLHTIARTDGRSATERIDDDLTDELVDAGLTHGPQDGDELRLPALVRAFALTVTRSAPHDRLPGVPSRVDHCQGHRGGLESLHRNGCQTTRPVLRDYLLETYRAEESPS